jgi:hypothetical protein
MVWRIASRVGRCYPPGSLWAAHSPAELWPLRLADTMRCGADIDPCVYVRMIRILIKRVVSLFPVSSEF